MKNHLFVFIAFILFASCSSVPSPKKEKELKEKIARLENENISLKTAEEEKDKAIKDFVGNLNEISHNLEVIKQKENVISLTANDVELNSTEIEKISNDILLINDLMDKNRRTIDNLSNELENSIIYSEELKQIIDNFSMVVNQQEIEIQRLHEQLMKVSKSFVSLQHNIDSLNAANEEQMLKIAEHEAAMNTGYYISGFAGYLSEKEIVSISGGIFGLGSVFLLNEDFDKKNFTSVKISDTRKIPLNCRSAQLLSVHPSNSYKFDGPADHVNNLVITRPREFWSNTRYLVILKK